jgi:hypothetical protein
LGAQKLIHRLRKGEGKLAIGLAHSLNFVVASTAQCEQSVAKRTGQWCLGGGK